VNKLIEEIKQLKQEIKTLEGRLEKLEEKEQEEGCSEAYYEATKKLGW
jgi:cell division septum initiation protein DivIVA